MTRTIVIGGIIAALAVGFVAAIFVWTRPRGEKIGEVDLMARDASVAVEARAGDRLFFRADVAARLPLVSLIDDEHLEQEATTQMSKSKLTLHARSAAGVEKVASCSLCNGRSSTTAITSGRISRSGMLNDCVIDIDAPGPWTVDASVEWSDGLKVERARLETRREGAR